MSSILWSFLDGFSVFGLMLLPVVLIGAVAVGYSVKESRPLLSETLRRSFWILLLFGVTVMAPLPLVPALAMVDLLLLMLGISLYSKSFSPSLRRYGRLQTWSALICLANFALLWQAGLLDGSQSAGGGIAQTALMGITLQLTVVGLGVWATVMLPLVQALRHEK